MAILLNYISGILLEPSDFQPDVWHDQLFCLNFDFTLVEEQDKNIQLIYLAYREFSSKEAELHKYRSFKYCLRT